jgi:hypothetical protein
MVELIKKKAEEEKIKIMEEINQVRKENSKLQEIIKKTPKKEK